MQTPVLSLLFPLYRSKRFLKHLTQQLENLSDPRFEIIVSDRHCLDDTIDVLQNIFANDSRFTFIKATDCLNWIAHYNFLFQQAKGKYFCWVPHDDDYSSNYFELLVSKMEEESNAIVGFATMHVNGNPWQIDFSVFKDNYQYPFTSQQYMKLLNSGIVGVPFRGVFRRKKLNNKNLFIKEGKLKGFQDMFWTFAVLFHGGFIYTEETSSTKNYFNDTAQSSWRLKMMSKKNPHVLSLLYNYLYRSPLSLYTKLKLSINFLLPLSIRKFYKKAVWTFDLTLAIILTAKRTIPPTMFADKIDVKLYWQALWGSLT